MLKLSRIPGVRIMPLLLSYYQRAETVAEFEVQLAARWLRVFGLEAPKLRI